MMFPLAIAGRKLIWGALGPLGIDAFLVYSFVHSSKAITSFNYW